MSRVMFVKKRYVILLSHFHYTIVRHWLECEGVGQAFERFYGVMVSTLDFESSDPSSNLGRTSTFFVNFATFNFFGVVHK